MFVADLKKLAKENTFFRKVINTGKHSQLVLMSLPAGTDIGEEVHPAVDQMLFIVEGKGKAVLAEETQDVGEYDCVFVPAGTVHNLINAGEEDLKLYTVYAPANHPEGTVHETKADAMKAEG